MKLCQAYHLLIIILSSTTTLTVAQMYAKPGCNDTCGDVRTPYPFGIGEKCSINEWYTVDCNSRTPYLSALNNLEVLYIDLGSQTVTVNVSMISDCQNLIPNSNQTLNLGSSPFLFSRLHNKFVVQGCGNAVILDHGIAVSGCSTTCRNETAVGDKDKVCLGVGCCQTDIPHNLKSYSIDLTGLERQGGDGACGSAFLVDEASYFEGRFSGQDTSYVPISLLWTLANYSDSDQNTCCTSKLRVKVDLGNGTSVESWKCWLLMGRQGTRQGNPYLSGGCSGLADQECARCLANRGFCEYHDIYDDDDRLFETIFNCSYARRRPDYPESKSSLAVILGTASFVVFINKNL